MWFLHRSASTLVLSAVLVSPLVNPAIVVADQLPTPEKFLGFRVGDDNKLARWDKIVEYLGIVAAASDRVELRELGKSTNGNPFIALEISAPETLKNLDHFKQLERKLYFQNGAPTETERDQILKSGKAVVLVTCNIHATEIGSSQMVLELVHRLATEDSPVINKILDNVIFLLVPSLNPDGQIIITDWYNRNVGTEYEASPVPWLYHPYVGHDNNRDMYMFTQKESQLTAQLLWHDWFPAVWLDEHQMGSQGARIFVMPATDPINPNVHPLIYRWNGIFGQSQAAALEAAGKEGIIYNSTYTNFWQGAMAWSGWWHNQVGLLTEVASVRIASPIEQRKAQPGQQPQSPPEDFQGQQRRQMENPNEPLPPPRDVTPRTEYPRPWLGGKWTLRDIVDYELIVTMALLETAAEQREQLLRQIYEINRATVEAGAKGDSAMQAGDIISGFDFKTIREEYRGGIGDEGVEALREFVRAGGTLITLGASCDLAIEKFPIPVRNLKRGLTREQHFAPGMIVRVQVDASHPLGLGMPAETYGFYNNSPFFALVEGFASHKASVAVRYPNSEVVASGWLKGEDLMAGRAAIVSVEMNPGRIVLFGLRPQHRAQTRATFPLLFNALYAAPSQQKPTPRLK